VLKINPKRIAIPLVIAVTGHRDLVPDEVPGIRERVRNLLADLAKRYPERRLRVMSPLAEGADRLVAREAVALGVELIVPLPMPREAYIKDFQTEESVREFDHLCAAANEILELPVARRNKLVDIADYGPARDLQYAQVGIFLCAHCHILLAIWDGKLTGDLGGTGQVVRFHHDDIMEGYTERSTASQQMLVDDESDLVYHIVCSRDRPDGKPHEDFEPLQTWWFTKDEKQPRRTSIPPQHEVIFKRSGEFSRDARRHALRISQECYPLYDENETDYLPKGIATIHYLFCISDWLAIFYQKRVLFALRATHALAFLMGLMFILYTDWATANTYMFAFLGFFVLAYAVQRLATRSAWNRKYLDYRALAEGLRVQFYWAAAGVTSENESKFTHDNFLQTQDPELGWIRNIMRVAGTRCDARPETSSKGLAFVLREWIGDAESGQLGYYRRKADERLQKSRNTDILARVGLLVSVLVVITIILFGSSMPDSARDQLMVAMGSILLLVGIRHGYAFSTAESELIKQYEFMLRIFNNARRRLQIASTNRERRLILRALGGSALDEHAQWILMHRERSIDQAEIWRMGG
jgi:multisubunit Na+/H+ antiporter MnhB subunit